jgi:hypothetical protein
MTNLSNVLSNAVEDGGEDFLNEIIYGRMRELTKPLLEKFKPKGEEDFVEEAYLEAMNSFINTLAMGMAMYSLTKIMGFFFERGSKMFTALWIFIVAGTLKNKAFVKLRKSGDKGKKLFKKIDSMLGGDKTLERIEIGKMAQRQVDSYDKHNFHYQNQHQKIKGSIDNLATPATNIKANTTNANLALFTDLTFRGKWQGTNEHKRIYEKATGYKVAETGQGAWSSLHQELNNYTEFHKTANNEVINLATILTKSLAVKGAI